MNRTDNRQREERDENLDRYRFSMGRLLSSAAVAIAGAAALFILAEVLS